MHPQIIRAEPGTCPICGMALELRVVESTESDDAELAAMHRRLQVTTILTVPLVAIAMGDMLPGSPISHALGTGFSWMQLVLATPVVLWGGAPFCAGGNRSATGAPTCSP